MKSQVYKAITFIIAALGFIGGIVLGNTFKIYYSDFNIGIMISCWIGVVILCLIFYGIASVLEYLEGIKENNEVIVNSSSYSETEHILKNAQPISRTPSANEWKCSNCGKINQNYVGTCGCGTSKHQKHTVETWECPNCHSKNPYNDNPECPNCHWQP